jgi:phenylalanine ammonia-lyase
MARQLLDRAAATAATVVIDGGSLRLADVVRVAREGAEARLDPAAEERIIATRSLKADLIGREIPIYGVTTGFGDSAHRQIAPEKAPRLQEILFEHLGAGTGGIAPSEVARASMLLRANCLARGNSGVRVELVERLLTHLNLGMVPQIPERGSCGASGDLIPLSYVASPLVGRGVIEYRGRTRPAADVLAEVGLTPLTLEAKEGLGMVNGTSFMSAYAALALHDARRLVEAAELGTAMACEAILGNRGHFNRFLFEAKPHPGILSSGGAISDLLSDSELALDSELIFASQGMDGKGYQELERQVQDRYSIRCAPHVLGAVRDTLEWVERWVEVEINSSDDNPLFDPEAGRVQSGGNFYGGHMAQAMDSLKVALANLCDLVDRQLEVVVDEKFNMGLTPNLIPRFAEDHPEAGLHHGFKGMQLCCSAMTAEALHLSAPVSIHSRSTEAHNQDKVSMGSIAARDARAIVDLAQHVVAIHLLACAQALELRGTDRAASGTRAGWATVRELVPFLGGDRRQDADIAAVVDLLKSGAFAAA